MGGADRAVLFRSCLTIDPTTSKLPVHITRRNLNPKLVVLSHIAEDLGFSATVSIHFLCPNKF